MSNLVKDESAAGAMPEIGSHQAAPATATAPRPRVFIIGAGFGGLSAAKALASAPVDLTVIDRRNYHLLQPLLYH